jgi:cellulose synthase operon protein C
MSGRKRTRVKQAALASARALVAALILLCASIANAESLFHQDLMDAEKALASAKGPEAYSALRQIWAASGRADPTQVEDSLIRASQSARLAAPVRAYAALLGAYSRSRRGDLAGAKARIAALGYVNEWLVVGPFDNEGKAGFEHVFEPETEQALRDPIVPGRAFSGKERAVRWRSVPSAAFPYGWLDAGALLRPEEKICFYATTFLRSKQPNARARKISLWVGASGAFKLFWNGLEVLSDSAYRGFDSDRFAAPVTLHPGSNRVMLKVCGDEASPVASLRIADARGAPDTTLAASAALEDSQQALPEGKLSEGKLGRLEGGPYGPMQEFERLLERQPHPEVRFAYAEYLITTNGDDPTIHRARDLAREVAQSAPTVKRLLLAAELAEDRNLAGEWIGKASALSEKNGEDRVDVLLAQAWLRRTGPNHRLAFPYYTRVLALDPDNVSAVRGRVELYNEAGLKRTALNTLEQAAMRNPTSVNLLNMYASQLHALGRTTEAMEVEQRYAGLRFDDQTLMHKNIELSLARGNRPAAERWVERMLEAHPENQWSYTIAAKSYRALGQPERALATYQRALELIPDEVGTLRTLADLHGELNNREEQVRLLRQILQLRPQEKEVREYLEHIEPAKARPDEAYAMAPERFLPLRHAPARGDNRRTLRDLTVTTVYANGLSSKFRQIVFQPLTDSAAAMSRQHAFQYESGREVVQLKGARVFRGDGRVDEAIEYGEAAANDPSISMYTSARNFIVQLPRLDPGDVVELRYRIDDVTPRNEYADYFGEVVYLQSDEPVHNAEYVLITPKSRKFYIDTELQGLVRSQKATDTQRIYRFFAKQVPGIDPEMSMPPWPEVLGFVHVSTYENFQQLARWYWGLSKDQFDLDDETRKLVRAITKDSQTELDKVKAVYGWVVKNTRYVALEFGIYGHKPRRCVQTVARGWGDCKDKATVIVSMLRELGIDSTIVIVRTQMRGDFKSSVASLAPYDHAIAYVPKFDLYLDGTAEYTGVDELPRMDLMAQAILVNQGDAKVVRLPAPDPEKNVVTREVSASLDKSGDARLDIRYETRGVEAANWRRRYEAEATRRERLTAHLGSEFSGFEIDKGPGAIRTGDLQNFDTPVTVEVTGRASGYARREGQQLSLPVTVDARLTPAFASLSRRKQDVRILAFSTRDDTYRIKLPLGSKVISTPPSVREETEFGGYSISVEQKPGEVVVKSRLVVKADRIKPNQYPAWKKFCAAADQALSHRLIISR